ncbi:MAG: trypsin-like peptidase domain-containing protein [Anaerolineae bacterium]|nr:trypsin-like peptidase domain-containing protein [Anaerolineae bacterium]
MANTLAALSKATADAVEKAGASIVRVEGRRRLPASGIVWAADGVIVTAHHVVTRDDGLRVGLPGGSTVAAAFVGRDPSTDLAVLKADITGLTTASWVEPGAARVGELVLAAGRPGAHVQATLGVISALNGGWRTPAGGHVDQFVQADIVMYPGFSGGPLINAEGVFVGLMTSGLVRGMSLAIPVMTVGRVAEALLRDGYIRRGYLGVSAQPARLPEPLQRELKQETGLLIVGVEAGSPAETAGLMLGDTIVTFNNQPMRSMDDLLAALADPAIVDAESSIRMVRGGLVQTQSVHIGIRG